MGVSILNNKYFFFVFFLCVSILCKEFIYTSVKKFYLFQIDRTASIKGIIIESLVIDKEDRVFDCKILYSFNDKNYKISERITSPDTVTNFRSGDSISVDYNVKEPWEGTINYASNRMFEFFAAIFILAMFIYSGYRVVRDLYFKINTRKKPL